jgi:hypothetical protein
MVLRPQKQATSIGPLALAALRMGTVKVIGSLTSQRRGPSLWVKVSATIAAIYLVATLWLWQQMPPKPRVWNPLFGYLPQGQVCKLDSLVRPALVNDSAAVKVWLSCDRWFFFFEMHNLDSNRCRPSGTLVGLRFQSSCPTTTARTAATFRLLSRASWVRCDPKLNLLEFQTREQYKNPDILHPFTP